jgi:hypothetical protein
VAGLESGLQRGLGLGQDRYDQFRRDYLDAGAAGTAGEGKEGSPGLLCHQAILSGWGAPLTVGVYLDGQVEGIRDSRQAGNLRARRPLIWFIVQVGKQRSKDILDVLGDKLCNPIRGDIAMC